MNVHDAVKGTFERAMQRFDRSSAMTQLAAGELTIEHYKAILREIYHYAKEDPQIQGLATVYFRGSDRDLVRMFFKHATSEIGHDRMALDDLATLGADVAHVPSRNPLPATTALTAFPFYQITYRRPIGYLGYLYFLEHMPTRAGARYAASLLKAGVPDAALSFLREHATVDVAHNELMNHYLGRLVHDEDDLKSVNYAILVTGQLYADMLAAAIADADSPIDYGDDAEEVARMAEAPTSV